MQRLYSASFAILILCVGGLAACSSPTAPSGGSTVTINGSVVPTDGSASSLGSPLPGPALSTIPPGLTVSVNGTTNTAIVNAAGRFSLLNLPPGNAELRFNAPGVLATVTLTELQPGQTVELAVTVTETTAAVESDRRSLGREEQLEGRVEALPPVAAVGTLVVAGRLVTTDASTTVWLQGSPSSFSALEVGQRVHVKGETAGGSLLARRIDIQNTNTTTGVNLNGVISNFTGTIAAFQFDLSGRLVKGDASTVFFGNSTFADLANGEHVQVKGAERNGFVYGERVHVFK